MTRSPASAVGRWICALVGAALLCGCGTGPQTGTASGRVTHNGQPLAAGDVNFLSAGGNAAIAKIGDDGKYTLPDPLPAGVYKVYVTPPRPEPQAPGAKVTAKKFDLPPKFRDPGTSGVSVTVQAGANDLPVAFKD